MHDRNKNRQRIPRNPKINAAAAPIARMKFILSRREVFVEDVPSLCASQRKSLKQIQKERFVIIVVFPVCVFDLEKVCIVEESRHLACEKKHQVAGQGLSMVIVDCQVSTGCTSYQSSSVHSRPQPKAAV